MVNNLVGNLTINPYTRIVTDKSGRTIYLTAKEFDCPTAHCGRY